MIVLDLTAPDSSEEDGRLSSHVYHEAKCPDCGHRACLMQTTAHVANRIVQICPYAPNGLEKCLRVGCCHGCECLKSGDCDYGAGGVVGRCQCDCHMPLLRLRQSRDVIELDDDDRCVCPVCQPGCSVYAAMPLSVEYRANNGDDNDAGGDGYWVSNRPRECRHFQQYAASGVPTISTYFDNRDGSNHRLERFFKPLAQ